MEQVTNVAQTGILRHAWARQQPVSIHGWIYAIENGLLRDLNVLINGPRQTPQIPAYQE
jgi:carbonic anhydrase